MAMAFGNGRLPVFCGEDNMIKNLPVRAHEALVCLKVLQVRCRFFQKLWSINRWAVVVQPLRGCISLAVSLPRVAPGAIQNSNPPGLPVTVTVGQPMFKSRCIKPSGLHIPITDCEKTCGNHTCIRTGDGIRLYLSNALPVH